MRAKLSSSLLGMILLAGLPAVLPAAEPAASGEDRLRAALRDATLQVRTAQTDLANAQTTNAALTEEKKALAEKFEMLKKQAVTDRAEADHRLAALQAELAAQKNTIAQLTETLAKTREEGERWAATSRETDARCTKLAADNLLLARRAEDREAKNLELFRLGNEILKRYEQFTLGQVMLAKEPFIGLSRTRLENLVQDYQDKLADQRAKP